MEKSSNEIMKEIFYLFEQYMAARKYEESVQNDRINYLEIELNKQREKNRQIAAILTRD
jgi:hypothetical protein